MLLRVRTGEGTTFKVVNSMSVYVLSNHPSPLFAFKYKSNEGETMCMQARCVLFTTKYTVHNLKQHGITLLTVCFVNTGYIWIDQY